MLLRGEGLTQRKVCGASAKGVKSWVINTLKMKLSEASSQKACVSAAVLQGLAPD